jgi:hypothetical protein
MAFNPATVTSWSKRWLQQGPPSRELRPEMNRFPRRTEEGSGCLPLQPRGPRMGRGGGLVADNHRVEFHYRLA